MNVLKGVADDANVEPLATRLWFVAAGLAGVLCAAALVSSCSNA
jgi:hypothetical protein